MKRRFFKRHQRDGIFNYYEIHSGGYITVNFLNEVPIISATEDATTNASNTRDIVEAGTEITEQEYSEAYTRAFNHENVIIQSDEKT